MQPYPGIDFRWTPAGRAPCVTGTGLTVWEVHAVWLLVLTSSNVLSVEQRAGMLHVKRR